MNKKVTRIIVNGIPYKLVKFKKEVDDLCGICSLRDFCFRIGEEEYGTESIRHLCKIGNITDTDTIFVIDLESLNGTIKMVLDEELI